MENSDQDKSMGGVPLNMFPASDMFSRSRSTDGKRLPWGATGGARESGGLPTI
jgi:hypothetical protein